MLENYYHLLWIYFSQMIGKVYQNQQMLMENHVVIRVMSKHGLQRHLLKHFMTFIIFRFYLSNLTKSFHFISHLLTLLFFIS
jgi:hypothetical protein